MCRRESNVIKSLMTTIKSLFRVFKNGVKIRELGVETRRHAKFHKNISISALLALYSEKYGVIFLISVFGSSNIVEESK